MALFQPIDWKPTDFSGLAEIGTHIENLRKQRADERRAEENSAIQREYAANQNRRVSADIARQEAEDRQKLEDRKQKEALDRWQALPAVLRLAQTSPEMANANPYGIKVSTETTQPTPITSALPMFASSKPSAMASNEDARGNWIPPEVPGGPDSAGPVQGPLPWGQERSDLRDAHGIAGEMSQPETHEEVPDLDLSQEAREATAEPRDERYVDIDSHRLKVPQYTQKSTGLGLDYDQLFNHALELGVPGKQAYQLVIAKAEKDAATASKDKVREDTQDFNREMQLTREDKLSEAEKNRAARAKKGGKGGGNPFAPGSKEWEKEEARLSGELKNYQDKHGIWGKEGLGIHVRDLKSSLSAAQSNPNGQQQLQILDKMIRAATGLGVRNQTLQLYSEHLGGWKTRLQNMLSQSRNGKLSDSAWKTVVDTLKENLSTVERQQKEEQSGYDTFTSGSDQYQRHPDLVKRSRVQMFGEDSAPTQSAAPTGDPLIDKYRHLYQQPGGGGQ